VIVLSVPTLLAVLQPLKDRVNCGEGSGRILPLDPCICALAMLMASGLVERAEAMLMANGLVERAEAEADTDAETEADEVGTLVCDKVLRRSFDFWKCVDMIIGG
jgi:hypothetical protein